MKTIIVRDQAAGKAGMKLSERTDPAAAIEHHQSLAMSSPALSPHEAIAAFKPTKRINGKTVIRVRE